MCVCVCVCVCVSHQATESSLKRMQQRMQEAEKMMIRDDVATDNVLQIVGTEEFPRPRGIYSTTLSIATLPSISLCTVYIFSLLNNAVCLSVLQLRIEGSSVLCPERQYSVIM